MKTEGRTPNMVMEVFMYAEGKKTAVANHSYKWVNQSINQLITQSINHSIN